MVTEIKSFFEHQRTERDICDALLPPKYGDEDRNRLVRFLQINKLDKCLSVTSKSVYPASYVGTICYCGRQIEILPKLLSSTGAETKDGTSPTFGEDSVERRNILHNLIFMLSYTRKLDILAVNDADISQSPNPFLEILIREFALSLFEALKRQTPRAYVRQEENLNYIKGKIQISANIRYNCCNQAKFYCEYDEFSEDNHLNRFFNYVAIILCGISCNNYNKQVLTHIRNYYCDISLGTFTKEQARKIVLSRSQQIFAKPLQLARMFIEHASVDMSTHRIESIALLWNMNELFEEFIYEVMRRHCTEFKVEAQKGRKLLVEELEDSGKGRKKRNTYVDILVTDRVKGGTKIVVDTKYKKFMGLFDFANADVYQVTTYSLLHDSKRAMLIYPQSEEKGLGKNSLRYTCTLNTFDGKRDHKINFCTVNLFASKNGMISVEAVADSIREALESVLKE